MLFDSKLGDEDSKLEESADDGSDAVKSEPVRSLNIFFRKIIHKLYKVFRSTYCIVLVLVREVESIWKLRIRRTSRR